MYITEHKSRRFRTGMCISALLCLLLEAHALSAQKYPGEPTSPNRPGAQATAKVPDLQTISNTGLLPVYGIDLRIDPASLDEHLPSQSPAGQSLQQRWDLLKKAGFNMIRVRVDIRDQKNSVNRIANLCQWAKSQQLKLLLVLPGLDGNAKNAGQAGKFVTSLVSTLKAEPQAADAYLQIGAYELDEDVNNPGLHGQTTAASAQPALLAMAKEIRDSERAALSGTAFLQHPSFSASHLILHSLPHAALPARHGVTRHIPPLTRHSWISCARWP